MITWEPKESFLFGEFQSLHEQYEQDHPYRYDENESDEDELSEASSYLFQSTHKLASTQVSSTDIRTPKDMVRVANQIQKDTKPVVKSTRIQKRESEASAKRLQEEQMSSQHLGTMIQLQGLKMLKNFMESDDNDSEWKQAYVEMHQKQTAVENKVNTMQVSLDTILSLLKEKNV